jgi:hypothetical protein
MSNVEITVDASDVEAVVKRLLYRVSPLGINVWLGSKMLPWLQGRISARFVSEGDEASGKWAQLMDRTASIRASQGFPPRHPINVRTGQMRHHLETSFGYTAGGTTLTIPGPTGGLLGEKIRVAQRGGGGRRGVRGQRAQIGPNRPAVPRPPLAVSALDVAFAENSLTEWINRAGL